VLDSLFFQQIRESAVTVDDVIHQRRIRAVAHANQIGNITQAAAVFGISPRPCPAASASQPDRVSTRCCLRTAGRATSPPRWPLADRDRHRRGRRPTHTRGPTAPRTPSGTKRLQVQVRCAEHPEPARPRARARRVASLATRTTATTGQFTCDTGPIGFCHWVAQAGDLVGFDAFYVGNLKGIGPVWQLTACDTRTRWTIAEIYIGRPNSKLAAGFPDLVINRCAAIGFVLSGVIVDAGREFKAKFRDRARLHSITVTQTPPRSPDFNAIDERVQGTLLQGLYRPTFHRGVVAKIPLLNQQLQRHLERHNGHRRNHGDWMRGRTPLQALTSERQRAELSPRSEVEMGWAVQTRSKVSVVYR
jgi:hypothetical protein